MKQVDTNMSRDIKSILLINRYLTCNKNDERKTAILRSYMRFKMDSVLNKSEGINYINSVFFNIPLALLMF